MSTESQHFTAPRMAKPIDPVQRFGMELDYGTLYVVLCGGFPTLMTRLCFRENVQVSTVQTVEELRDLLNSEERAPADLAVVYSDTMQDLPPLTFRSPVDGHQTTVIFMLDPMVTDEGRLNEVYALTDQLLEKKKQYVKGFSAFSRNHPSFKEDEEP